MIYRNAYTVSLDMGEGIKEDFHLRLTISALLALKKKHKVSSELDLILKAVDDIETVIEIFSAALSFKDNENKITDGTEFYELLVENDYKGAAAFSEIIFEIACASGLIKEDQKEKLANTITNTYDRVFDSLESSVDKKITEAFGDEEQIREADSLPSFREE